MWAVVYFLIYLILMGLLLFFLYICKFPAFLFYLYIHFNRLFEVDPV